MAQSMDLAGQVWLQVLRDWSGVDPHWRGLTRGTYESRAWAELDGVTQRYLAALIQLEEALEAIDRLPWP